MAANRVGKTTAGAFEVTCHATGLYPSWWEGRQFDEPVEVWCAGTTTETTRDIVQMALFGPPNAIGSGMIPGRLIESPRARPGVADSIETVWVKHVSGKYSHIGLKTYQQGRTAFEGTAKHVIWCDEEPPLDAYTEMLFRTITVRGLTLITFTPLQGRSSVINSFLEPENEEAARYKWYIQAGWDDCPHLDEAEKQAILATTPPYQIDARTKGSPSLGAGAVYPIPESEISCAPFDVPSHWPRAYGLDTGWRRTACIWGCRDPSSSVIYLYSEHYQGQGEPASHADAIRSRGEWIEGVIDPSCLGSSQVDGRTMMEIYERLGLRLTPAVNAVEAGIAEVWQMLVGGKLKVMTTCQNWLREFRGYCRDERTGRVNKRDDHLMDATRYLVVSGRELMKTTPTKKKPEPEFGNYYSSHSSGWMR